MPISEKISNSIGASSWIRKMFEEGIRLKREFGDENVFDFSLGNPDLEPPIEFFDTLRSLMQENRRGCHGYMPNAGFDDVRAAIAAKVASVHGVKIQGGQIVMCCGAAGGLNVVLKTLLNPGEEVIVPRPYFVEYGFYVENHGGKIVLVDTNGDFSLNLETIKSALNAKTKAVIINSPNNPTGRVYTEEEIQGLAALLKDHRERTGSIVYLVADEPYRELAYGGIVVPSILKAYDQSIVVTSYSKTLSIPGERIGYIAVNPACADLDQLMAGIILCNRILGFVNAPAYMQRAVARLTGATVNVAVYEKRRDVFAEGLSFAGYNFTRPEGAFYIFCKSPIDDDVAFVRHLQKYNVLVVPGSGFGGPGYFRIAYCISEKVITRAIPKFKEALSTL